MLWYLHLCSTEGIVVTGYEDTPTGAMVEDAEGGGRFVDVTLRPNVRITDIRRVGDAGQLHHEAHRLCFIANSVNFPVRCEPHIAAE
jgi:organic hydroperoxide reductase OsmC/OhrA